MGKTIIVKGRPYTMKYRPDPISRLSKYDGLPPPMVGDPPEASKARTWSERAEIIYEAMTAAKRGIVPMKQRIGIWFYELSPPLPNRAAGNE